MLEVRGGEGLPDGFVELAQKVYEQEPLWIPEDPAALERAFSSANPWFEQGEAMTLCEEGAARLACFFQPALRVDGRSVAFFGYWETIGVREIDRALFGRALAWAAERGAQDLYGPINFTTFGNYRLRLACEPEAMPFPDEPVNPRTYPGVLLKLGFDVDQHYLTQLGRIEAGRMVREWKRPTLKKLEAEGYRFDTMTHELWLENLAGTHKLVDAIFGANFAYSPLSYEAFASKCGESFIRRACPNTSTVAFAPDGSIAGFFLVYPHYGPLVIQGALEERVDPAVLDYATHAPLLADKEWRGAVAKTVGVAPEHRSKGVMDGLTVGIFDRGDGRYENWFGAMIRKGNPSKNFGDGNIVGERWYGLFRKRL
jgi:hypothetical protein